MKTLLIIGAIVALLVLGCVFGPMVIENMVGGH